MTVSIANARRPMIIFDYAPDGKFVIGKIMQHGDKFTMPEVNFEEWIAAREQDALQGRYDASWVAQFKLEYEAFKKGNELPREGTPVRTWGAITREQGTRLISLNVTTLEDLAAMPDSGLGTLGLDGRYLRDLAKSTLSSATGSAAVAKELADAQSTIREQGDQLKRLEAMVEALKPKTETLHVPEKKKGT